MSVALLVVRVIVGSLFAGHGSQKLFGWFKGYGLSGTGAFFDSIGLAAVTPLAVLAGVSELAGGLLLAFGFLLPVACLLLTAVMAAAIAMVHWKNGLWVTNGGFEYPLVMAAVAFAVAAIGPGSISLDNALGIDWASLDWAIAATIVGALGASAAIGLARIAHRTHDAQPHPAS